MPYQRPHFVYDSSNACSAAYADMLMAETGNAAPADCDVIVCIGGDGMLLQALSEAAGKPVYALTPPDSNSNGFWTDHDVRDAATLRAKLDTAQPVPLVPLRCDIRFANGNHTLRHAFNDVSIERASGQSALINLSMRTQDTESGPHRILGDGFIFSTAMGSTGTNRSYLGPVVDIHNDVIIMTGKGIYEPRGMAPMIVNGTDGTMFCADFASVAHKRPVRIDYDGRSIERDSDGSPIDRLTVSAAHDRTATLLLNVNPAAKAFASMLA